MTQKNIIQTIFKDSNFHLSLFTEEEIDALRDKVFTKTARGKDTPFVKCIIRNKDIQLKPEEIVRQLYAARLINQYGYPKKRLAFEYAVSFGREKKSADIVIFDKDRPDTSYIIVELKKPKLKDGKNQLRSYCNATGAPIGVWTNGEQISHYHRKDPNYFEDITDIPKASQSLKEILSERFTLKDLIIKDKIANESKSLKDIILEMEDEVLANAGVDVFEEVFKLIFTKLYDEFTSRKEKTIIEYHIDQKLDDDERADYDKVKACLETLNDKNFRVMEFRNTGQTDTELKKKIQELFDKAKKQWSGVFSEGSEFELSDSHLSICVSSLQDIKLFNSNLLVVDEAFEYLVNKSALFFSRPKKRLAFEYAVSFGREKKSADIVIFDKDRPDTSYIIVELKKPKLKDGKNQLRSYCNATGAPIGVWTNGEQISHYHRKDPNYFEDITDIPKASQSLKEILSERFTLKDLIIKDKIANESKSLKDIILEMEDEVLANAGVDVFEEVFKLIFTKLYDEFTSRKEKTIIEYHIDQKLDDDERADYDKVKACLETLNDKNFRVMEFRNTGQTDTELKKKIQELFDKAKKQWSGVFSEGSEFELSDSHLSICVSSLQDIKLFNSNLLVVDEAFEYLVNKSAKGEKGQYFTPRHVIDMCVKMLNPKWGEYMIDTASGSCGFPVHTIFHITGHLFTNAIIPEEDKENVLKVFGIDFDEKTVRVARTLNLIAGDCLWHADGRRRDAGQGRCGSSRPAGFQHRGRGGRGHRRRRQRHLCAATLCRRRHPRGD